MVRIQRERGRRSTARRSTCSSSPAPSSSSTAATAASSVGLTPSVAAYVGAAEPRSAPASAWSPPVSMRRDAHPGSSSGVAAASSAARLPSARVRRAVRRLSLSTTEARRSMMRTAMAQAKLARQMSAPDQREKARLVPSAMAGEAASLNTEPRRASARFSPSASASSLPPNHLAMRPDMVTLRDSPPRPKITRPVIMTAHFVWVPGRVMPSANTHCPIVTRNAKMALPSRSPMRSEKMPPSSGRITLGHE
mmetsp:Transcript_23049/g.87147  ORF Transcript_23049/g.87147 Transcript_23049/m.87147 type:complete len:251 (-) Transcript_23049:258-1010(-)